MPSRPSRAPIGGALASCRFGIWGVGFFFGGGIISALLLMNQINSNNKSTKASVVEENSNETASVEESL